MKGLAASSYLGRLQGELNCFALFVFIWGLYFCLIFTVLFFLPMFGLIGYFISTKSPDPATVILSILFIILLAESENQRKGKCQVPFHY